MEKRSYWGSVRFFRHLIAGVIGASFFISLVLCPILVYQNKQLRAQVEKAAAEAPAWESRYPGLYAPEADVGAVDADKTVYLTFDGGPSDCTDEILDILEQYGIQATFFVTGSDEADNSDRLKAIADGGHTVGMHSDSGDYQRIYASVDAFLTDYQRLFERIQRATGQTPAVFRFPGGSINGYNSGIYQELISEMLRRGFVYFDWNVSGQDGPGGADTAVRIKQNALAGVSVTRRPVIRLHDGADSAATVEALPDIIAAYAAAGYAFAPLTPEVLPVIYGYLDE